MTHLILDVKNLDRKERKKLMDYLKLNFGLKVKIYQLMADE